MENSLGHLGAVVVVTFQGARDTVRRQAGCCGVADLDIAEMSKMADGR